VIGAKSSDTVYSISLLQGQCYYLVMMVVANKLSPQLQKIFLILGVSAYIAQTVAYVWFYIGTGSRLWHLSQFTLIVADTVLLPVALALLLWWASDRATPRRGRLSTTAIWVVIGLALQALLGFIYRVEVQRYVPYDGTHWYEPWAVLMPSVVTLIVVIITAYIIGRLAHISLTVWRASGAFVVLAAFAYSGIFMLRDTLHQHVALQNSIYFAIGALVLGGVLLANYLLTTKESDSFSVRLYASTVYVMMAGFIFAILGGVWMLIGLTGATWIYATASHDVLLLVGVLAYGGLLFWHKRQQLI
jgi:hypothetical protein